MLTCKSMFLTRHFHRNLAGFVLNLILLASEILNLKLNFSPPPPELNTHKYMHTIIINNIKMDY